MVRGQGAQAGCLEDRAGARLDADRQPPPGRGPAEAAGVSASVRRGKGAKRVLSYKITPQAGQQVTFAEVGKKTAAQLGKPTSAAKDGGLHADDR